MSVDVAAFDVDGTLTVRDCVVPFLAAVGGSWSLASAVARRPIEALGAAVRRDRDRWKSLVVGGVLGGRPVAVVECLGEQFAERVERQWLRDDTVARLRWHQQMGHLVVFVSASLGPYLRPLGARLGVDDVLCAEPLRVGDCFGDGLDGPNCRAAEKVRRLDAWLAGRNLQSATVWAYGDSPGDRELLARADHPLLVKGITVPPTPVGSTR